MFSYMNRVEDAESALPLFVSQLFENKNVDVSWFHVRLQLKANRAERQISVNFFLP